MEHNKPDIAQIRKYLNGELNARDMYQLERQAQDDPFLADVIRGMESSDEDPAPHLAEIDRLIDHRVQQNRKWVIGWRWLPVAASLLIALGIGGWWFKHQPEEQPAIVKASTAVQQDGVEVKKNTIEPALPSTKPGVPQVIKPTMVAKLNRTEHRQTITATDAFTTATNPATPGVTYKFDTTEYKAAAYPVRANKSVDSIYGKMAKAKAESNYGYMDFKQSPATANTATPVIRLGEKRADFIKIDTSAKTLNQVLLGRVDGVQVEPSGVPHDYDIRIRGLSSIADNKQPLYLLNGQAVDYKALSDINPNQIKDISILKDQSATAVYGSRAANGVVLITTNNEGNAVADKRVSTNTILAEKKIATNQPKKPAMEEVLKKLPGVTVDSAGNVTSKGQAVTKVRINGKDFNGGNVQQATKNLPADIIDKIQMIDDYGDQANMTGIKSGSPAKVMNIVLNKITGKITAQDDNQPIPGASVKVKGSNEAVQTDVNGRFSINAPLKAELEISFLGYQNKQVSVNGRDSVKVALATSQKALSEVVVIGYGEQKRNSVTGSVATVMRNGDVNTKKAHPATGQVAYQNYLDKNAITPDGKTGMVKLTLTILPNGSIGVIRVTKSVDRDVDQKAISLIKNGSAWVGDGSGKPKEIKLEITFK